MKQCGLFCVIFVLFFSVLAQAQKPDLRFERLTDESGRSLGFITGITQDTSDFMWISTRSGLYRYDGYNYREFRNVHNDSTSIPFNDITNLYYDREGVLWLKHYDKYIAFSQNKLDTTFRNINNKQFHFSAEIIQDNQGGRWIGPTPEGLHYFAPQTNRHRLFVEAQPLYRKAAYRYLDSLLEYKAPLASLEQIGNNADTTTRFTITEPSYCLIAGVGEMDEYGRYDYGRLLSGDSVIWEMNFRKAKYAGGASKNRMQVNVLQLQPGAYTMHYNSDNSHATGSWNGIQPDKTELYGVGLFRIGEDVYRHVKENVVKGFVPDNTITTNKFSDFLIARNGRLHIISRLGMDIFNAEENSFRRVRLDFKEALGLEQLNTMDIHTLYQTRDGMFWIGTSHGLVRLHMPSRTLRVFRNTSQNPELLADNTVYTLQEDNRGRLWIGTNNGLNVMNRRSGDIYHYYSNVKNRLYDNRIIDFYLDKSGNMWLATPEGMNRLKKKRFFFVDLESEGYTSFPMVVDSIENAIWYRGKDNMLYKYNRNLNRYRKFPLQEAFFPYDERTKSRLYTFNDMVVDRENLWFAIEDKLISFNKKADKATLAAKADSIEMEDDTVGNSFNILVNDGPSLWLYAMDGVYRFNKQEQIITAFYSFNRQYGDEVYSINDFVKDVQKHPNGSFWIRTVQGIFRFSPDDEAMELIHPFAENVRFSSATSGNIFISDSGKVHAAYLPSFYTYTPETGNDQIVEIDGIGDVGRCSITPGADSLLWIATNNGLFRFHPHSKNIKRFTSRDNLADNDINDLVKDGRGHLWISSSRGLTQYNPQKQEFSIVSQEFVSRNFVTISAENSEQRGELLFFTREGFYSYFPDSINTHAPKVVVTSFKLFGEEVAFDTLTHLKKNIVLDYNENFFTFEFAALDFTNPTENRYRYMLEGLDKDWTTTGADNRMAPYTALPPGNYTFRLQGANNDGIWSDQETRIEVEVIPPLWQRPWAYVIYVVVAALTVVLYIRRRERNLKKEKHILEQKVAERTEKIERQKEQLGAQRDIATQQRDQIAAQKQNITDSIMYARRIQNAILPPEDFMQDILPEHFILNKPRDIVSGDYYWVSNIGGKSYIVAADCTGHGVPGAFMSMLGVAFLNEIVNRSDMHHASEILGELRSYVMRSLHQTGREDEAKDGMDLAMCIIDEENMRMEYAGAFNPLYLIRDGELHKIKADRMPIGIYFKKQAPFTNHVLEIRDKDAFYIFSDGYIDQFGGKDGRKFMARKFQRLLLSIQDKTMPEQKQLLEKHLQEWMNGYEQVDDILVVGVRIKAHN